MGAQHAEAYQAAGAEVVAVCDVDAGRAADLAGRLGARDYTDVGTMIAEVQPQAMSICTPPSQHLDPALTALGLGVPLLVEKPLADSVEAARRIVDAAAQRNVPCMVGFCHRFHEPVLQIKERLDAGQIGSPVLFRNRFAYNFEGVEKSWFSNPAISGGGTLMDTSVHSLDLYRFLIGEIDRVSAQVSTVTPGLTVEDNSVLLVNGPHGVPGIIEASWTTPSGESELIIFGTRGNLGVDYEKGDFGLAFVETPEEGRIDIERTGADRFTAELSRFLQAAQRREAPSPGLQDGLRTLEVIDSAVQGTGAGQVEAAQSGT
jgi:predicted dehydrogenase